MLLRSAVKKCIQENIPYMLFSYPMTKPQQDILEAARILQSMKTASVEAAPPPPPSKRVLIFDVETTGLLPKTLNLHDYPYIIQFSMIVYELQTKTILKEHSHYVDLPQNVTIPAEVTKLTGITNEVCRKKDPI